MAVGRRREVRYDINLPLRVYADSENHFSAEIINLSSQGLYCRVPQQIQPYSKLKFSIDLPFKGRTPAPLVSEGIVLRSDRAQITDRDEYGAAILFTSLDLEKACLLRDFLLETATSASASMIANAREARQISGRVCPGGDGLPVLARDQYLMPHDRLRSLEDWVSQLGHEINNPLAAISAALQALADEYPEDHPSADVFHKILGQVVRLEEVADNLLQMAHPEHCHFEPIRLEGVLNRSLVLLENKFRNKMIDVQVRHGQNQPPLRGDRNLLQEALLQILGHASENLDQGSGLTVHTCWGANSCAGIDKNCICTWVPSYGNKLRVVIMDSSFSTNEVVLKKLSNRPDSDSLATDASLHHALSIVNKHQGMLYVGNDARRGKIYLLSFPMLLDEAEPVRSLALEPSRLN